MVIASHWPIRNLILTHAFAELQTDFEILAWVPETIIAEVASLADDLGIHDIGWMPLRVRQRNRLHTFAYRVQKSLLLERHQVATEKLLQLRTGRRTRLQRVGIALGGSVACAGLFAPSFRMASALRRWSTPVGVYAEDFDRYRPDTVLSTDAISPNEDAVYFEAKRRSVPIVSMVGSWDNVAKGPIHGGYDRIFVWNQVMLESIRQMYPAYRDGRLTIIGIPRFDVYREPLPPAFRREAFLGGLGLDPAGRVLLHATNGGAANFPTEREIVRHVVEALEAGKLPGDCQLLVRPHPHEDPANYRQFAGLPRVAVSWPKGDYRSGKNGQSVPDKDSLWDLAACLKHSCVCINAASTIALDAAACDIPIVSVAYDGDQVKPYYDSILSAYEFTHQIPFLQYGATVLCRSRGALIAAINEAIADSRLRQENRLAVARDFLNCHESSVQRLRIALAELAAQRR